MENDSDENDDDIELVICPNNWNGTCAKGSACTKFHPHEDMHDDDPNNE